MCKKLIYLFSFVLLLGSVIQAEDIKWTDLGADHLWSTPENWDLGRVPTLDDEVLIDVPAAAAPNGPVIQDGIDAKAKGIWTEAPGEPMLTITGGTLEVAEWIWWGDGDGSYGIMDMSGGTLTTGSEFELGWGGGAGTLTMTGGTINAFEAVIPTGSGAFGILNLYGGTYNVTKADGLSVKENGMVDITEGTLVLEGDDTAKVNDLIAAGLITSYGGAGTFELDFDVSNAGKTTLTAVGIEKTVLFAEDFEGLVLGPNVDESLAGDAVWTDTPPEGWTVDESGIPGINMDATDGITEWAGWAFADKAWWTEAAGDQDRSLFELGSGIVAVADPDEWDDGERLPIPIAVDPYDTWLTTPEIKIGSAEPGTLELKFDSSWRPEFDDNYHQTANITASFDGGEPVVVMLWESDEASANYKPYATNETVIVKLDAPEGAKKVVLTFGLFDAGNDWWWAIDNLEVRGLVLSQEPVNPGADGLVAYYALDGDVIDGSGNGLDGTIMGDPAFVEGMYGMALDLNGDDYVDCGTNETLNTLGDAITVSAWVNIRSVTTTWMSIVMKGETAWRLGVNGDTTGIHWGFTGGDRSWQQANSVTELPLGEWHHIAGTYDKGVGGIVWVDAVAEAENPDPDGVAANEQPLLLGENPEATGRLLDGLIDEVRIYDRMLSEVELRYLAGQRATPVDPGANGLVAFYAFENDATDSSGNEIHGTLVGDAGFAEGPDGYGMALNLDGDGDYVDCGASPLLDITEEITFTFWIKAVALDKGWNTVLSRGDDSWRSSRAGTNNFMEAAVGGTSGNYLYGATPVDDDKWHHVGAVYDGATFSLYVDGELDGSEESTGNITASSYPLYIGNNSQNTDREWTGLIDEVIIYDRALSTGEIRYLAGFRPPLVAAFAFGSRALESPTYNVPSVNYTMVLHDSVESVQYNPDRGYGYEVIYPADSPYGERAGYGIFGPFDDSPNNRNEFPDELPEELYDSFIGAKSFLDECSAAVMGDMDTPCPVPEGIIFRVDVPNGLYRFVGAFGEADNGHAHRILAEDGGSGPPENIGTNYVVLVSNHDQSQYDIGEIAGDEPGDAVFARVGFDGKIPPPGDGVVPSPVFVDMDENGLPTDAGANSPVLEVTQGYIRIHQLQGNSNDSPSNTRDANGGDIVILELWKVD